MKKSLGFSDDKQLLNYIKVKTVNTFNPTNLYVATGTVKNPQNDRNR